MQYSKDQIVYQDTPSLTFARVIVKDRQDNIILDQNPVEDNLWTCDKHQEDVGYIVTSFLWTLHVYE